MFGLGERGTTAVFEAATEGDVGRLRDLLRSNVELVKARATASMCRKLGEVEDGETPLHRASAGGHFSAVELLLLLKAEVNAASSSAVTPLHLAAQAGSREIVDLLLERGGNVNAGDDDGRTALHRAATGGHTDLIATFLNRGVPVDTIDGEGGTALHLACRACHPPAVNLLLNRGANVNARNHRGLTPLHEAALGTCTSSLQDGGETSKQIMTLLLRLRADINALDENGETPLDLLGFRHGNPAVDATITWLQSYGAQCRRYQQRLAHAGLAAPPATAPAAATVPAGQTFMGAAPSSSRRSHDVKVHHSPVIVGAKPILLGREDTCDVQLPDRTVSRRHARLERRPGGVVIEDLGSRNGTLINGTRTIGQQVVHPGDVIAIGVFSFRFDGGKLVPVGASEVRSSGSSGAFRALSEGHAV